MTEIFELSRLNVHRIVASEGEKVELIALGYKEVTREEFLEEVTADKTSAEEIPVDEVPAVEGTKVEAKPADAKPVEKPKKSKA